MSESNDEEEDWSNYASAGYSSAYDPWADLVPQEETEDFDDDFEIDEFTSIRPPPSDEGLDHLVSIGTCDYCIVRLSGQPFSWDGAQNLGATIRKSSNERGATKGCLLYTSPSPRD